MVSAVISTVITDVISSPVFVSIIAIFLLFLAYRVYTIVVWYREIYIAGKHMDPLPGDAAHWLWGNLREIPKPSEATILYLMDYARRHGGRIYKMWFGPFRPAVMFHHPDTIKLVMRTNEPKALRGNGAYAMVKPWLGEGLLVAGGAKWQRNRKLLTPAFHFDILKPYMSINNSAVDILLNKWSEKLKRNPGASIEIYKPISLCTLDIILRCAFSYSSDVQTAKEENKYVTSIFSMAELIFDRAFNMLMYIDWIYYRSEKGKQFKQACDYVHDVAEEIIAKRKKTLETSEGDTNETGKRKDFLDIILLARDENGKGLTDIEIRNEVDTFLFEGHDTTASGLTWILYNLARHPEIQERVHEEVSALLSGRDSPFITWNDVSGGSDQLGYLTMCIKESLRLHPPVPFVVRDLTAPMEVEGVTLQPGTILDLGIYLLHHNPQVWGEDHMEYRPERFSPENIKSMDPYAFVPFAAGPRNCIGQVFALHELKTITARIIHKFRLEVDESHKVEMLATMVLRAKNGVKLRMTPRF